MARDEKMSVGRYIKRNTLYIVLTMLLVLLIAGLIAVLVMIFRKPAAPQPPRSNPINTIQSRMAIVFFLFL